LISHIAINSIPKNVLINIKKMQNYTTY